MTDVVPLRAADRERATAVLAAAFQDDPMMAYALPDPEHRRARLGRMLGGLRAYCERYGEVVTTPDVAGVAAWLPPGATDVPVRRVLRSGMATATLGALGVAGMRRLFALSGDMERAHHEEMTGPHWYLWLLGTDPARAGTGVGTALLRPTLARADADGVPVYLDTHSERNVGFYSRFSFEPVRGQVTAGVRWWGLRRPPATSH